MRGIAYMEGIVCPVTWDDWPESARGIFQGFRSAKGEDLVLQRNMFVDAVLPSSVMRGLGEEEMQHYRAPFSTPDDRQPTLNWPRQIPIDGEPPEMVELVASLRAVADGYHSAAQAVHQCRARFHPDRAGSGSIAAAGPTSAR